MADHLFLPSLENLKQPFCLADSDPNIDFTNHFPGIINPVPGHQQQTPGPGLNIQSLTGFPLDNNILFPDLPQSPAGLFIHHQDHNNLLSPNFADHMIISNDIDHVDRKRKAMEMISITQGNCSTNSSPQVSDNGIRKKNGGGRGKKMRSNTEKKQEKLVKEVVHVRAKRGQATDSHSLAERVRREKINERLRCLQDIVPGCYKTMGMAVMLDEIINYVQSLQNQVEFLSMKLTAASTFYDFNSETYALETMQRAKELEALKIQSGGSPGLPSAQFAPSDLNFGYFPHLPHNR